MESLYRQIKNVCLKKKKVSIDTFVSKLHYRVTSLFLLSVSLFISSKMFISDTILCKYDKLPVRFVEQYCLTQTTFSYDGTEQRHHWEYQWVAIMLFMQAASFYCPRFFWKWTENGCISKLIQDLNNPILKTTDQKIQIDNIKLYWINNKGTHSKLPLVYFICESLNTANLLIQVMVNNWFLGGLFLSYGSSVVNIWSNSLEEVKDPMNDIFPSIAKCTISSFSTSGNSINQDILCVLPLNVVHKNVYLLIWIWFLILSIVTVINILLLIPVLLFKRITFMSVAGLKHGSTEMIKLRKYLDHQNNKFFGNLGDAFMIKLLLQNINNIKVTQDIISSICISETNDVSLI